MKKMIFLAISVVCVGQLVGMEQPEKRSEPATVQELRAAILRNINTVSFITNQKIWRAKQDFADLTLWNTNPESARALTNNLIKAIESAADPKSTLAFDMIRDDEQKLMKALEYLNKLKRLI